MSSSKVITLLLYTEEGMNRQAAEKFPRVKNPEKNWLDMASANALEEVEETLTGQLKALSTNTDYVPEYDWDKYKTPALLGSYFVVYDKDVRMVPTVKASISETVKEVLKSFPGYYLKSDVSDIQQPYKLYQQITIGK